MLPRGSGHGYTTETFLIAARIVHGDRFDYSGFEYRGDNKTLMQFVCRVHGPFMQRPNGHLMGDGCRACANALGSAKKGSWEAFITAARQIHGDRYSYVERDLRRKCDKVAIACQTHGQFLQDTHHHIDRKQGCRACCFTRRDMSGYVPWTRDGWVKHWRGGDAAIYMIECSSMNESFIKVGITGQTVQDRFAKNGKRANMRYSWRALRERRGDPGAVFDLEARIKTHCAPFKHWPRHRFPGHTECYSPAMAPVVERLIEEAFR